VQPTSPRSCAAAVAPPDPPDPAFLLYDTDDDTVALAAVYQKRKLARCYWDNACSKSTTPDASLLYDVMPLPVPQSLGGIAGGCTITHSGKFRCLPSTNGVNDGYLALGMPYTLLSLGHIVRCGGRYHGEPGSSGAGTLSVYVPGIVPPVNSVELGRSNLSGVCFAQLLKHVPLFTNDYRRQIGQSPGRIVPVALAGVAPSGQLAHNESASLAPAPPPAADDQDAWTVVTKRSRQRLSSSSPVPAIEPQAISVHHNKEQLARVGRVVTLRKEKGFPSDDSLCADLAGGKNSYSGLTCADVKLRTVLQGPCPHFHAGRYKQPPATPSDSAPATAVGQCVSIDLNILPALAPGGFTQELFVVDEHSGRCHAVGLKSKATDEIYDGLLNRLIRKHYNAYGHRIATIFSDPEKSLASLAPHVGGLGIALKHAVPDRHATRVERHYQTMSNMAISVLSSLHYILPDAFTLLLHEYCCSVMGGTINSRSSPSTPDELFYGRLPSSPTIPFGTCCMVKLHTDKRVSLSKDTGSQVDNIPRSEVGVSMGPCPSTGATRFLVANGSVVSRCTVCTHLHESFIPFNWSPKQYIPGAVAMATAPAHTTPAYISGPNVSIQATQTTELSAPQAHVSAPSPHVHTMPLATPFVPTLSDRLGAEQRARLASRAARLMGMAKQLQVPLKAPAPVQEPVVVTVPLAHTPAPVTTPAPEAPPMPIRVSTPASPQRAVVPVPFVPRRSGRTHVAPQRYSAAALFSGSQAFPPPPPPVWP
jgi:hypothetical protein